MPFAGAGGPRILSASSLACLFASRFVPAAAGRSPASPSFGTGTTVDRRALAETLPIIALWALEADRQIAWRPSERRRWALLRARSVHARLATAHPVAFGGLEAALLAELVRRRSGADVEELVRRLATHGRRPADAIIECALADVAGAGYLCRRGGSDGDAGLSRYAPVEHGYAVLALSVDALAKSWRTFIEDPRREPLRRALTGAVRTGLRARPL